MRTNGKMPVLPAKMHILSQILQSLGATYVSPEKIGGATYVSPILSKNDVFQIQNFRVAESHNPLRLSANVSHLKHIMSVPHMWHQKWIFPVFYLQISCSLPEKVPILCIKRSCICTAISYFVAFLRDSSSSSSSKSPESR